MLNQNARRTGAAGVIARALGALGAATLLLTSTGWGALAGDTGFGAVNPKAYQGAAAARTKPVVESGVRSVALPNGFTLIPKDSAVQLWRTANGTIQVGRGCACSADSPPWGLDPSKICAAWLTITPEGFFDSSAKGAELVRVERGREVYSFDQFYQSLHRPDLVLEKLAGDADGKVREAAAKLDLTKVAGSGAAPQVVIGSPTGGATVNVDQVGVESTITDQGGGIGRVEWRVNGTTLGVEERGLGRGEGSTSGARTITVRQTLSLTPGENVIEVAAYNGDGLIASLPAVLKVTRTGQDSTRPRLNVLAVGINDYFDSRLRLAFAASDAKTIADGVRQAGNALYERVDVTTVLDAEATHANLDKVFAEVANKVRPQDVFLFFLAGHGKTIDGRYYFLPQDFRYQGEDSIIKRTIGQDQFQKWFSHIAARKSIMLYDTCESGSLTSERPQERGLGRVEEERTALDRLTQATGRTVLSASTDDTPALEGYKGHGVFTYVLLDALGQADTNGDGVIDVTELASYVDRSVPKVSFAAFKVHQIPQMKIVGSNFPVINQTVVLPSASEAAAPFIPSKPTHVVTTAAEVFANAAKDAPVHELTPGMAVTLVQTQSDWTLVARNGKALGYIASKDLIPIQ
jgi:hypothetical protein